MPSHVPDPNSESSWWWKDLGYEFLVTVGLHIWQGDRTRAIFSTWAGHLSRLPFVRLVTFGNPHTPVNEREWNTPFDEEVKPPTMYKVVKQNRLLETFREINSLWYFKCDDDSLVHVEEFLAYIVMISELLMDRAKKSKMGGGGEKIEMDAFFTAMRTSRETEYFHNIPAVHGGGGYLFNRRALLTILNRTTINDCYSRKVERKIIMNEDHCISIRMHRSGIPLSDSHEAFFGYRLMIPLENPDFAGHRLDPHFSDYPTLALTHHYIDPENMLLYFETKNLTVGDLLNTWTIWEHSNEDSCSPLSGDDDVIRINPRKITEVEKRRYHGRTGLFFTKLYDTGGVHWIQDTGRQRSASPSSFCRNPSLISSAMEILQRNSAEKRVVLTHYEEGSDVADFFVIVAPRWSSFIDFAGRISYDMHHRFVGEGATVQEVLCMVYREEWDKIKEEMIFLSF